MESDHNKSKSQLITELEELRLRAEASSTPLTDDGHYKQMVDGLPQMIYEMNLEGNLIYANPCALETFGYSAKDLKQGLSISQVIHPDYIDLAMANLGLLKQGKSVLGVEYIAVRSDGSTFPIMVFQQGIFENGAPVGFRGTFLDISRIRHTEEAREKSEIYYRTLFENTGTALVIIGNDSIIRKCNSQFESLSGYHREEIESKRKWLDFIDPVDLERMQRHNAQRLIDGKDDTREYDFIFLTRSGIQRHVHAVVAVISGTEDRICSLSDVTGHIRAQEALRTSEERYSLVVRGANDGFWGCGSGKRHSLLVSPVQGNARLH